MAKRASEQQFLVSLSLGLESLQHEPSRAENYLGSHISPQSKSIAFQLPTPPTSVVPKLATPISLVQRRSASEVSTLGSERPNFAKRLDTTQHELDSAVRSARSVTWKLMAGELDLVESHAALGTPGSQVAGAGEGAAVVFGVVGGVEGGAGVGLETLEAVPLEIVSDWFWSEGKRKCLRSRSGWREGCRWC